MSLNFCLSDEQKMVQQAVKDALKQFEPRREEMHRKIFKEKKFPYDLWHAMADIGLMGCLIPEEYGGNNLGLVPLALALDEMGKQGLSNALMVVTAMDAACIVRNGSSELKQRFLPDIASGKSIFCFAITEPDAGSNAFKITTHAEASGSTYILNGQKVFITGVDVAQHALIVARTTSYQAVLGAGLPKSAGMSLFVVDTKTDGFKKRLIPTHGIEGLNQYHLFFDQMKVPKENLVGALDQGASALFNSLNTERILAAALSVGLADHLLTRAVGYAKERKVFGDRAIGSYQALSHPLAKIKAETEAARMLMYRAADAFDRKLDPNEIGKWANMAKMLGAEAAIHACDQAIETLGGYGFSEEYGVIYFLESTRLLRTAPITKELILNYVAEHVLGLPKSY